MPEKPQELSHDEAYRMVGEFLSYWAIMEDKLNGLIGKMLGLSTLQEVIVTHNIKLHDKLGIAGAALDTMALTTEEKKAFRKKLADISNLSWVRNMCAHNGFGPKGENLTFYRYSVRGKVSVPDDTWSPDEHVKKLKEVVNLRIGLDEIEARVTQAIDLGRLATQLASEPKGGLFGLGPINLLDPQLPGILGSVPQGTTQETIPQTEPKPQAE